MRNNSTPDFVNCLYEHFMSFDIKNEFITASEIMALYLFEGNTNTNTISHKISQFFTIHPNAVRKISRQRNGKNKVFAIKRKCLDDFFEFAKLIVVYSRKTDKIKQPKINPETPGYKTDPTLATISDEKIDKIAWNLASKKVLTAGEANEMLFAELEKSQKQIAMIQTRKKQHQQ